MKTIILNNKVIYDDMLNICESIVDYKKLFSKSFFITGSTGMIASYMVTYLIFLNEKYDANIEIYAGARSAKKLFYRFGNYINKKYFHTVLANINQPIIIEDKLDYIIHAASLASPQYYENMPIEVALPNVIGTYHLLNMAKEHKVDKFLFFSSGDIYGKVASGIENIDEKTMGIMDPLDMHSCYGESKRMGETLCSCFSREYNVPVNIARIGHTYGPTMDFENDPRVFASFIKSILNGEDIVMLSDGTTKRPFCYIADAVAAFLILLLKGEPGEAYNVCNTKEFLSIRDLADILVNLQPELNLKVIKKERTQDDVYLENKLNVANKPVEYKLNKLG